jgi:hypothetical protein
VEKIETRGGDLKGGANSKANNKSLSIFQDLFQVLLIKVLKS